MQIWGGGGPNTPLKISKFFNLYICSKITKNIYRSAHASKNVKWQLEALFANELHNDIKPRDENNRTLEPLLSFMTQSTHTILVKTPSSPLHARVDLVPPGCTLTLTPPIQKVGHWGGKKMSSIYWGWYKSISYYIQIAKKSMQ